MILFTDDYIGVRIINGDHDYTDLLLHVEEYSDFLIEAKEEGYRWILLT